MKYICLILISVMLISPTLANSDIALRRSNGLLRFMIEQEGQMNLALSGVIGTRCSRYMPEAQSSLCKKAVKKMIQIMDYDILFTDKKISGLEDQTWAPQSFVFVVFKQKLISLLSDPKTKHYLNDLNQELNKYLLGQRADLNIWETTKTHYINDFAAAMVMAVLFQDTSLAKLHINYLDLARVQGSEEFFANKELLGQVIGTINLILDLSEDNFRSLFYPQQIQQDLNRNIYHFYVPLYLTKALEQVGVKKENAYAATLMLNLSYEFITTARSYRYLFNDPEKINDLNTIKDIYGGYCGSSIGADGLNLKHSFHIVEKSFLSSTADGVKLLLKN